MVITFQVIATAVFKRTSFLDSGLRCFLLCKFQSLKIADCVNDLLNTFPSFLSLSLILFQYYSMQTLIEKKEVMTRKKGYGHFSELGLKAQ